MISVNFDACYAVFLNVSMSLPIILIKLSFLHASLVMRAKASSMLCSGRKSLYFHIWYVYIGAILHIPESTQLWIRLKIYI